MEQTIPQPPIKQESPTPVEASSAGSTSPPEKVQQKTVVDLDEYVRLARVGRTMPKDEVLPKARDYCKKVFEQHAKALVDSPKPQRELETMALAVGLANKRYICNRHDQEWKKVFAAAERCLEAEVEIAEKFLETIKRDEERAEFEAGVLSKREARLEKLQQDVEILGKLVLDLKDL